MKWDLGAQIITLIATNRYVCLNTGNTGCVLLCACVHAAIAGENVKEQKADFLATLYDLGGIFGMLGIYVGICNLNTVFVHENAYICVHVYNTTVFFLAIAYAYVYDLIGT